MYERLFPYNCSFQLPFYIKLRSQIDYRLNDAILYKNFLLKDLITQSSVRFLLDNLGAKLFTLFYALTRPNFSLIFKIDYLKKNINYQFCFFIILLHTFLPFFSKILSHLTNYEPGLTIPYTNYLCLQLLPYIFFLNCKYDTNCQPIHLYRCYHFLNQ